MMKYLLSILLALPALAMAQVEPPACFPLVNGYPQGVPKVIKTDIGTHLFWFCGDVKRTKVEVAGLSCEAGQCSDAAFAAAVSAVTRASAKVGTARALWAESVTVDCKTDTRPLCVERSSLIEQNRAAWRAEVVGWVQP
jgi:hypothetical protein